MKNKIILIMVLVLAISGSVVMAASGTHFKGIPTRYMDSATGIVQKTGRNTIEIIDEQDNWRKRFVYLSNTTFQPGERVRIYYRVRDSFAENVVRMTPVNKSTPPVGTPNQGYF